MPSIVIVDDRVTNRRILSRLASELDSQPDVETFGDPVLALGWLERNEPDLVITDYMMPNLDGAEFVQSLRRLPTCSDVPVIVVTAYEDKGFRYDALNAGATDFLLSPVDHEEFRARAHNLLTLRYQQSVLKRRTHIVRVFPNGESCLRLIRALAVETHEDWLEANRYINMKLLKEHKREQMKKAA